MRQAGENPEPVFCFWESLKYSFRPKPWPFHKTIIFLIAKLQSAYRNIYFLGVPAIVKMYFWEEFVLLRKRRTLLAGVNAFRNLSPQRTMRPGEQDGLNWKLTEIQ
jgi:hypothetical protein